MTKSDLTMIRGVLKEEIETSLKPVKKSLNENTRKIDENTRKLEILWDQVEEVTVGLTEVKDTQKDHTAAFKKIITILDNASDNIKKLNKRTSTIEDKLGIIPPPELTIP